MHLNLIMKLKIIYILIFYLYIPLLYIKNNILLILEDITKTLLMQKIMNYGIG